MADAAAALMTAGASEYDRQLARVRSCDPTLYKDLTSGLQPLTATQQRDLLAAMADAYVFF